MEKRKIIQSFVFFGFVAAFAAFGADKEQQDQVSQAEQSDSAGSKWGYYMGEPVTKWNPDGRTMTLLTELRYTDPHGEVWVAQSVRSSMGHPFRGIFGQSWAGRLKANIGTLRCCTTSRMASTSVRGRIATGCFIT